MTNEKELTTEERIKVAATKIFIQKGYAGARTRDIAEEAGINLALLNYYYRSKEKLFEIIMMESMQELFFTIRAEVNNKESSLEDKIEYIVNLYFTVLSENPNILLFVLGELRNNPDNLTKVIGIPKNFFLETFLYQQLDTRLKDNKRAIDPFQIILNIFSLSIFPFLAQPLFKIVAGIQDEEYKAFLESRRKLIPVWIKAML